MNIESVIVGIGTGALTGFYTGLVTYRYGQFQEAKNQARLALFKLTSPRAKDDDGSGQKHDAYVYVGQQASSLTWLGHYEAANELRGIASAIRKMTGSKLNTNEEFTQYREWLKAVDSLRPSIRALFLFRGVPPPSGNVGTV